MRDTRCWALRARAAVGCALLQVVLFGFASQATELSTSARDSEPFFVVKDGVASGVCPDLYAALERVDPSLQIRGANKVLSLSLNEQALALGTDAINCGFGQSPHRDGIVRYAQKITTSHMVVAVRADDPIEQLRDLQQLKTLSLEHPVIVRRGTVFADRLKQLGVVVDDSSTDNAANLRKLVFKRGRFYYNIDYLMAAQMRDPMVSEKLRVLPTSLEPQPLFIVVSKKLDPGVDARITAAFKVLKANGELSAIFKKYGIAQDL
ncbi:substrate-binding periplasmic protein [Rhodoferax aquaticus]|uniref:Transporter substrate-binding domain-containing protein n=1 Tax=Rhodoferax aquaticus TaxID=2527691 RepID=A0A515EJW6_9BURK|nr:transporter substrate-binding domain-containing protein [Rhodoferax aquaticus]QDL52953.1 transporter substrate-binding domain-containing protein [Rhodoferax aquaticus]